MLAVAVVPRFLQFRAAVTSVPTSPVRVSIRCSQLSSISRVLPAPPTRVNVTRRLLSGSRRAWGASARRPTGPLTNHTVCPDLLSRNPNPQFEKRHS
jgi:hypothetical protein